MKVLTVRRYGAGVQRQFLLRVHRAPRASPIPISDVPPQSRSDLEGCCRLHRVEQRLLFQNLLRAPAWSAFWNKEMLHKKAFWRI